MLPRLLPTEPFQPSSQPSTGHRPAIVLVEDEPDVLTILHRLMRDLQSRCDIVAVNGADPALAQLGQRVVPLLITDYNKPKTTGLELTKKVKAITPQTRVVLITAYATPQLERQAREAGVDYYLPKPFALDQLEQIVNDTLV